MRQRTPDGKLRTLVTGLDSRDYPCHAFADLYDQRWRIEQTFKRLKLRTKLETVSQLPLQALIVDVAAKVLADNLTSLTCSAAAADAGLACHSRKHAPTRLEGSSSADRPERPQS